MALPPREPPSRDRPSSTPRPARTALELDIMRDGGHVRSTPQASGSLRTVIEFDRNRAATRSAAREHEPAPLGSRGDRDEHVHGLIATETRSVQAGSEEQDGELWPHEVARAQRALTHSVAMPIVHSSADLPTRELPADAQLGTTGPSCPEERDARWPLPSERVALGGAGWSDGEAPSQAVPPAPAKTVLVGGATAHASMPQPDAPVQPLTPAPAPSLPAATPRARGAAARVVPAAATFLLGIVLALQFGSELRAGLARLLSLGQRSPAAQSAERAPEVSVLAGPAASHDAKRVLASRDPPLEAQAVAPEQALALYMAGQRHEALTLYRRLAQAHPEERVYAEVARILESELKRECLRAGPSAPDGCERL